MTDSFLKHDPNTLKGSTVTKGYLFRTKTQSAKFWGNRFCQATMTTCLKQQLNGEKR